MSRTSRHLFMGSAALAALLWAWPVTAAPHNTERVLPHHDRECMGAPDCRSVQSDALVLDRDQVQVLAVNCPASHPFVWHWDTQQHEHLHVMLVGRTRQGLTFSVSNRTHAPGEGHVLIGCSDQPFDFAKSGFMTSRTGIPSQVQTFEEEHLEERKPQ